MKRIRILLFSAFCILLITNPFDVLASEDSDKFAELSLLDLLEINIEAASKEKEKSREAPVPVSVITRDMIKKSQARTLRDVILEYVPGFYYTQGGNEYSLPVRGVYSGSQDKVLILRNGIRLNSRLLNRATPDYGLSLENIQQIEIIRGPGASIYGNAALTGVINIVTRKPEDLNGFELMAGTGSYGQIHLSATYGKRFDENNGILMWATTYHADGEKVELSDSADYTNDPVTPFLPSPRSVILEGFRDPYTYDIGAKFELGDFTIHASARRSKYIDPFSANDVQANRPYDYDQILAYDGTKPGSMLEDRFISLNWEKSLTSNIDLSINGTFGTGKTRIFGVNEPSVGSAIIGELTERYYDFSINSWFRYEFLGKGRLLVGAQYELLAVGDGFLGQQVAGDWAFFGVRDAEGNLILPAELIPTADESTVSAFIQTKHYFTDNFLVNLGIRYDERFRFRSDNINEFSPRVAAVWLASEELSIKLSWARSFVDAPYGLRFNRFFPDGSNLKPERYSAFQLTPALKTLDGLLIIKNNVFLTQLSDFIAFNANVFESASVDILGNELEIALAFPYATIRAQSTQLIVLESEGYRVTDEEVHSIPKLNGSLTLDLYPIVTQRDNLWLHTTIQYIGPRFTPNNSPFDDGPNERLRQSAVALVHASVGVGGYGWDGWLVTLRVNNLLDTQWQQAGDVEHPYPQPGRWISAHLRLSL